MRVRKLVGYLFLLLAISSGAEIYKWVDEEGITHYTESPPTGAPAKELQLAPEPPKERLEEARQRWRTHMEEEKHEKAPQAVFGTLVVGFVPSGLAVLPDAPTKLTVVIQPLPRGKELRHTVGDTKPDWVIDATKEGRAAHSHHNFQLDLCPGKYRIASVEIKAKSLWNKPIKLPTGGSEFVVPKGRCVYIGRVAYFFQILSPGSYGHAKEMATSLARQRGAPVEMVYLAKGSLVPTTQAIDKPTSTDREHDMAILKKATVGACLIDIAEAGT